MAKDPSPGGGIITKDGTALPVDGGGMYPVGRNLFLSNKFFTENSSGVYKPMSSTQRKELCQRFEKTFGRKVIPLGDGSEALEPPFSSQHIDLYMMFLPAAGKNPPTIAIPDPELGRQLMKDANITGEDLHRGARISNLQGARLSVMNVINSQGVSPFDEYRDEGSVQEHGFNPEGSQKYYNNLSKRLESQGFKVIRLPVVEPGTKLVDGKLTANGFNYFNCITEVRSDGARVTMPSYGLKPVEDFIAKKLAELGYRAQWIYGTCEFARDAGVHCLTNDRRSAPEGLR